MNSIAKQYAQAYMSMVYLNEWFIENDSVHFYMIFGLN